MEQYGILTGVLAQRKLHGEDLDLLSYRECPKTKEKVLNYVSPYVPKIGRNEEVLTVAEKM